MVASVKKIKRYLILANAVLGIVIVLFVYCLLFTPVRANSDPQASSTKAFSFSNRREPTSLPLSSYAIVHKRNLRKPLFDPKPIKVVKHAPPKPMLTVSLVGTVLEPGFTYAILKNRSGKTKFVDKGEVYEDVKVTEITSNSVTIIFNGETITLHKNDKGGQK